MASSSKSAPKSVAPTFAQYAAEDFVQGAGVAIFHLASARVVVCSAVSRRSGKYYFLPKGRRDAGEDTRAGAEREGYEEVRHHVLIFPTGYKTTNLGADHVPYSQATVTGCYHSPYPTSNRKHIHASQRSL